MKRIIVLIQVLLLSQVVLGQNKTIELENFEVGELQVAGFSLSSTKSIHIEAEGAGQEPETEKVKGMMDDPNNFFAYAWIINAKSRELVWRMTISNTEKNRKTRFNRTFQGDIKLRAGEYEVYYSARKPGYRFFDDGFFSLGRLLDKLLRDKEWYIEDQKRWFIEISGVDESVNRSSVEKYHNALKNEAILSITGLDDTEFQQEGFRLKAPGSFEIYAVGEAYDEDVFDYGWIVDASNSQKIWETLAGKGEYAGGAIKNRVWKETVDLEPGNYWLYFVMDDSHSPGDWNANPPYDPDFYGITVSGVKGEYDPNSIETLLKLKVEPIVELNRLRDDDFVHEGFKLTQPMQVRVSALGEGRHGEMFDYGWIVDIQSGEKVWEMNYNRTRHGGGAEKNRLIDEVVKLPAGSYMVYYQTDGSHSFNDWNSSPPYNPSSWGITVYPADPKYTGKQIKRLEEDLRTENVLVQIIRVGNGNHIQKKFETSDVSRVRLYAIGEGDWDEMYDFGWIENELTGEKVWKMTYDKTRWAGGARKNRKVDETIILPTGQYILHYRTDGSHSYNAWNDDPPDDPIHYGITIYKTGE